MESNVIVLVKKTSLEFDKMANPLLQSLNLTGAQFKVVKYLLDHKDEPVRQVDIERFYSLSHPTTIGLLEKLEDKGLVERKANPDDARSRVVLLTEEALSRQDELIEMAGLLQAKLTSGLTQDERDQLVFLLNKLLSGMERS